MVFDRFVRAFCLLLLITGGVGACHLIYPFSHDEPARDAALQGDQRATDSAMDSAPDDLRPPDSEPTPPTLQCLSPVRLTSTECMIESALTADGVTLIGQQQGIQLNDII